MHLHDRTAERSPRGEPPGPDDAANRVFRALLLTAAFMFIEVAGGLLSGSLTLLADAGHMLTDTAALGFAWLAFRVAAKPADRRRSYGYQRFPILAAFLNGVLLIVIVGWIALEAFVRLREPVEIHTGGMLSVALAGLVVNVLAYRILHAGSPHDLNLRAASLHVLGDLLGSVAAIVAALVIMGTGWTPIDPIASIAVAALVLVSGSSLVRQSAHVLMEGSPGDIDVPALGIELVAEVPEVLDVHHVHVWSLTPGRPIMTLHARVREDADHEDALGRVLAALHRRLGNAHVTVQIEHERCFDPTPTDPRPTGETTHGEE